MKAGDIQPCNMCGKGVMHAGVPVFWRVTFRRMGVNLTAVKQTTGLEMLLGSVALARAMGPDPDIATPIGDERTVTVCEMCASQQTSIYELGLE